FLTPTDGRARLLAMILAEMRPSSFWSPFGNSDATSFWPLSMQDPSVANSSLNGAKTFSLFGSAAYDGSTRLRLGTLALPTFNSGAATAFLSENIDGNAIFATGMLSIGQFDNFGQGAALFNYNAGSYGSQSDSGAAVALSPDDSLMVLDNPASASLTISKF